MNLLSPRTLQAEVNSPLYPGVLSILYVGIQIFAGLSVLADRGVMHLDMKPANIGFNQSDQLIIFDFGLGTPPNQPISRLVGTPRYFSPGTRRRYVAGENGVAYPDEPFSSEHDIYAAIVMMLELFKVLSKLLPWRECPRGCSVKEFAEMRLPEHEVLTRMHEEDFLTHEYWAQPYMERILRLLDEGLLSTSVSRPDYFRDEFSRIYHELSAFVHEHNIHLPWRFNHENLTYRSARPAAGNSALVYEARMVGQAQVLALKMPRGNVVAQERVLHEYALFLSIPPHPNVVSLIGTYEKRNKNDTQEWGLVLEYIQLTLQDLLDSPSETVSYPLKLNMLIQFFSALEHLHLHKIIHRDIKPANIGLIRAPQGGYQVRLFDFDISVKAPVTKRVGPEGTWAYLAPENKDTSGASATDITDKVDIYAACLVAFFLLTGKSIMAFEPWKSSAPSFSQGNAFFAMYRFCQQPSFDPSSVPVHEQFEGISAEYQRSATVLFQVILRGLAILPEHRPTARALREASEEAATQAYYYRRSA